jgi:lauroyl/myristoyl acyltransferase
LPQAPQPDCSAVRTVTETTRLPREPFITGQDVIAWLYLYPVRGLLALLPVRFSKWAVRRVAPVYAWLRRDLRVAVRRGMMLALKDRATRASLPAMARDFVARDLCKAADDLLMRRLDVTELTGKAAIRGIQHLEAARAEGRGVIVVSGHFHANRLAKYYLRRVGYPMLSVRRREPIGSTAGRLGQRYLVPVYARLLAERVEDELYARDPGLGAGLLRRLRENGIVNVHIDAAIATERIMLRVLDIPWPLPGGFVRLAEMTGAPLVPMLCLGDSDGFEINFEAPIHLSGRSDPEQRRARLQPLAERLESWLLAHPAQWELWTRLERYLSYDPFKE